ncbi:MAG: cytochrome-c peroxidase, partial [Syntrophobacteraceae bacterium]
GSIPTLYGGRNAPMSAYAGFSPIFHYDPDNSVFVGGLFWDGRASGRLDYTATGTLGSGPTGDPLADQAKGPPGNPVEMGLTFDNTGLTTEAAVVGIIERSNYAKLFKQVFGPDAFADVKVAYNNASLALAAFERSSAVTRFKSKFDKFVKEQGGDVSDFGVITTPDGFRKYVGPPKKFRSRYFSYDEADGLAIFNADSYTQRNLLQESENGGQCYRCHLTQNHVVAADDPNRPANGPLPGTYNPLLTDFTFDNLGIPVNPRIAELAGPQSTDNGLGAQTTLLQYAFPSCEPSLEKGKFKVSSLRNISRTAPYGHNGYFATMYDIVHFYNTRDTRMASWPSPEVSENVNKTEMGKLGLTLKQELKVVKFLNTLDD